MKLKNCVYDGSGSFKLSDYPKSAHIPNEEKEHYTELLAENVLKITKLCERLFADGKEGLLIVFQALDAAGKDTTIKNVFSGVNPQHIEVHNFRTPTKAEAAHDFLWRESLVLPERGKIGIFNRSHYEECLAVRVHNYWKGYAMPERITGMSEKDYFDARYRACVAFEENLYFNGYRVLKFFLNVSKAEQKERFLSRMDRPDKNWKFSEGDLDERQYWDDYQEAFEDTIAATATKHAPWYIIPADQKFYMRWLVSEAVLKTLEDMDPQFPTVSDEERARYDECRARLAED